MRAPAQPVVRKTVLPPMRYLATSSGRCWFWSRYPPGYDSWNPRYDQSIIVTRSQLPQCRGSSSPPPAPVVVTVDIPGRAWSIFRSFPLDAPDFRLSPMVGITNLPSRLHLVAPSDFAHGEGLPDGRRLEVRARVESVVVEWGDGRKDAADPLGMVGDPGPVRHTYLLKTCSPSYRQHHLDGPKCHPSLDHYPVTVTFEWVADYRVGGSWVRLGTIDRPSDLPYDVDEVLGVLVDL